MDDPNDLSPWYYTAMLTGRGGGAGESQALAAGLLTWLVSDTTGDDPSPEKIRGDDALVRSWMRRRPAAAAYCFELDAIHEDLDWILCEMSTGCDPSSSTDRAHHARNAIVYHVHDFHYRVHAYREKVAQLLNAVLDLGRTEKQVAVHAVLDCIRDTIRRSDNPEHRAIDALLRGLVNDDKMRAFVGRRTLLTHRALVVYRSGEGQWTIATPESRAKGHSGVGGVSAEIEPWSNFSAFHEHELGEMREVAARLNGFRHDLTRCLRRLALLPSACDAP